MLFSALCRPADKSVPTADMPRRRGEGHTGHRSAKGKDKILEVLADRLAVPQVVILLDQAVEEFLRCGAPHLADLQGQDPGKGALERMGINGYLGGFVSMGQGIGRVLFLGRQLDMAGPVKLKH